MASPIGPRTTPADRLVAYRDKRDFDLTPEPSGATTPWVAPAPGRRFVVQRHRASHLHYDLRIEIDGVLVSWAVPKGPTLDPDVRRMAIHVEDHPLDYFDFEGVIPAGEYGGGDVIVWDWGTWDLAEGDDPIDAVAGGDLHVDLHGVKLSGRFALVRRGAPGAREQWLLIHKHDDHAVSGWQAEDHPASVKSGRTNDEVRDAPTVTWSLNVPWVGPTDDELDALTSLKPSGGTWRFAGETLKLTNLDKVLIPAGDAQPAVTKRDLIRHYASMAPVLLPYVHDRPINLHRFPNGITRPGFWHKARPDHAPDFVGRWHYDDADPDETQEYAVLANPASLAWAANFGAIELHPWTSTAAHPHRPTWAMIDIDPGTLSNFDDVLTLARLHRVALDHLEVEARPKVTGSRGIQIWVPVEPTGFDDTRTFVERLSRMIGDNVPELVSWKWQKAERGGLARLDYTQNAVNKTLVAPFSIRPRTGAPVSVPIEWDELDDPDLRPDRWTITDIGERIRERGDPLAPLIGRPQRLPDL
jgi:bifunctional non-homologous end joining protein LigD